ncbi:hypothetical protein NA57DRAFT_78729 [Rhizodiscina lignyota]|uniref:Uncharacterized protein n=1 Tax=Rhizodiscina lignyota TaxID=1504668 RepID=A0A9P4ICZ6_9PEZI|nr:hypothetical protein NA57DRAFT_78729 [Rhizodiscina lignyota]
MGGKENIVEFLLTLFEVEKRAMIEHIDKIAWVRPAELSGEVQKYYENLWPSLFIGDVLTWEDLIFRIPGTKILQHIRDGTLKQLVDDTTYACYRVDIEWGYFIDLENEVLETWIGGYWLGQGLRFLESVAFKDLSMDYMRALQDKVLNVSKDEWKVMIDAMEPFSLDY